MISKECFTAQWLQEVSAAQKFNDLNYNDLEVITLRRGVIGVRKVGYLSN